MRPAVKKKIILAAAASTGILGFIGYPAVKSVYPIKKQARIVDDYVDIPTATADLTKDIILPDSVGAGTDVPIDISHWQLLSLLKSKNLSRQERALNELARQRRWNDAECLEIAQALNKQDIVKLARTIDADLRLFLPPPSVEFIERTLMSNKIEKLVKSILKDVSERLDSCSSCTNFYTNLSINVRPDSNILAMSDLNQVDKMRIKSKKRKKFAYNEDIIKLKAVLNNVICGEQQALSMVESGMLIALLYFRHKYGDDLQINGLLSQILANLSANKATQKYLFANGWIQTLIMYTRSDHLEVSLPAHKALANLDSDATQLNGLYGDHVYLLSPLYRTQNESQNFDIIFVHGLVGSVFKSWRQGSVTLDEFGNGTNNNSKAATPTTELLPSNPLEPFPDETGNEQFNVDKNSLKTSTKCWPKDWLPKDVPGLRVLAVDYPTALSNWRTDCDLNKDTLKERAVLVMKQLEEAKLGSRPIIWVAHSMGGLLVKQILVLCDEQRDQTSSNGTNEKKSATASDNDFRGNLLKQTKGIVFYSVPHKGSNLDWIERRNLQKLLMLTTEVIELQKGSPILVELHDKFLRMIKRNENKIKFLTYAEDAISSFGVNKVVQWKGILVHEDSLQFEFGPIHKLHIDHAHTCKPSSKQSITYSKTLEFIRKLVPVVQEYNEDEKLLPFISFII